MFKSLFFLPWRLTTSTKLTTVGSLEQIQAAADDIILVWSH